MIGDIIQLNPKYSSDEIEAGWEGFYKGMFFILIKYIHEYDPRSPGKKIYPYDSHLIFVSLRHERYGMFHGYLIMTKEFIENVEGDWITIALQEIEGIMDRKIEKGEVPTNG